MQTAAVNLGVADQGSCAGYGSTICPRAARLTDGRCGQGTPRGGSLGRRARVKSGPTLPSTRMDPTALNPNNYAQLWTTCCNKEMLSRSAPRRTRTPALSESELTTWGLTRAELPEARGSAGVNVAGELGWSMTKAPGVRATPAVCCAGCLPSAVWLSARLCVPCLTRVPAASAQRGARSVGRRSRARWTTTSSGCRPRSASVAANYGSPWPLATLLTC